MILPLCKHPTFNRIMETTGGVIMFNAFIDTVLEGASQKRNGLLASLEELKVGGDAIIAKICFADGIFWAAKIAEYRDSSVSEVRAAIYALQLLEKQCPNIPIARYKGGGRDNTFVYYFTEWKDGKTLYEKIVSRPFDISCIRIPERVITSLAQFVYNLTSCQIPEEESNKWIYSLR